MIICQKMTQRLYIRLCCGFVLAIFSVWYSLYVITGTFMEQFHHTCIIKAKNVGARTRGASYQLSSRTTGYFKHCLLTQWNVIHAFTYFLFGLLFPNQFILFLTIGILFEIYEAIVYDCHDVMDIAVNSLGYVCGSQLSICIFGNNE